MPTKPTVNIAKPLRNTSNRGSILNSRLCMKLCLSNFQPDLYGMYANTI
jgi:hypothetical protein